MKTIKYSTRYKKDIKRYANQQDKLDALYRIVWLLEQDKPIPREYNPHILKGRYKGCWECHIQPDWLMIWEQEDAQLRLILVDTGTHSDLF